MLVTSTSVIDWKVLIDSVVLKPRGNKPSDVPPGAGEEDVSLDVQSTVHTDVEAGELAFSAN